MQEVQLTRQLEQTVNYNTRLSHSLQQAEVNNISLTVQMERWRSEATVVRRESAAVQVDLQRFQSQTRVLEAKCNELTLVR